MKPLRYSIPVMLTAVVFVAFKIGFVAFFAYWFYEMCRDLVLSWLK